MDKLIRSLGLLLGVLLFAGFANSAFAFRPPFGGGGGGGSDSRSSKADCYPTNDFVIACGGPAETGPTFASGRVEEQKVEEIELENNPAGTTTDLGPATLDVRFSANIDGANLVGSPGTMTGDLKATIHWKNSNVADTVFNAGCVQELETDEQTDVPVGEFEGEYEGGVDNFPGFPGTTKAAVASIVVKEDPDNPGKLEFDFSLELGITDYEDNGGLGDIEFDKIAIKNLSPDEGFNINNTGAHGEWSFPPGKGPVCETAD